MNLTWLAAGVVVLVVGLLIAGYVRSPLRGWRRPAALLCKLTALALLALCLLAVRWAGLLGSDQPVLVREDDDLDPVA